MIKTALLLTLSLFVCLMAMDLTVYHDQTRPLSSFAVSEIQQAIKNSGGKLSVAPLSAWNSDGVSGNRVLLTKRGDNIAGWTATPAQKPQAYSVDVRKKSDDKRDILIVGYDDTGLSYGGLDVAEALSMNTFYALEKADYEPYVSERGIKFNIPLDARTPSYADASDSGQAALADVWNLDFWREYFDEMARQRLNTLSLWNLHPFPSLVTVPEFPAVALTDVKRTLVPYESTDLRGHDIWDAKDMGGPDNLSVVKTMSPAEKTMFWNQVIDLADARGVSVYWFTWNIHTDGLEGNPYGIIEDSEEAAKKQLSEVTKHYFRASVRALLTSMPKLAGIGVTAGEQMDGKVSNKAQWLADTYGEAMNDVRVGYTAKKPDGSDVVVAPSPTRSLRLINRLHEVSYGEIKKSFGKFADNLILETSHKYSVAHTIGTTKPTFKLGHINEAPDGDQVWLTVRFDSQYNARWADYDFVKAWVDHLPNKLNSENEPRIRGFYMGPDGYVWARRPNAKNSPAGQLDIRRWWHTQYLFSRLSYNKNLSKTYFDQLVAARLNISVATATSLNQGLAHASRITPWLLRYFWEGGNDFQFFPEACITIKRFLTVKRFSENKPMGKGDGNGQSVLTMTDFCKAELKGETPINIADKIENEVNAALAAINGITANETQLELQQTLADIRISAAMGSYYMAKFRGARALKYSELDSANKDQHQKKAVAHLTDALARWKEYAALSGQHYYPMWQNRASSLDLFAFIPYVASDIAFAEGLTAGRPTDELDPTIVAQTENTVTLRVRGKSETDSEDKLLYYWYLAGTSPAPVSYSHNGTNAARDVTITFTKPGRYLFKAIILDTKNRTKDTDKVEVRVGGGMTSP
jgi:hypothetical protein